MGHVQLLQSYGSSVDGGFLVGYFTSCNMTPRFEDGVYEDEGHFVYPKIIEVNMTFNVLHDYDQGWEASTGFLAELFPEIGTGEDIGEAFGLKIGGETGEILGGATGIIGDAYLNDVFYENGPDPNDGISITQDPNDSFEAGEAPSISPMVGVPSQENQPSQPQPQPDPPPSGDE